MLICLSHFRGKEKVIYHSSSFQMSPEQRRSFTETLES